MSGQNEKKGFFKRLKEGLNKTRNAFTEKIDSVFSAFKKIDDELFDELEEALILADLGAETSMEIVEELRKRVKEEKITEADGAKELLQKIIADILKSDNQSLDLSGKPAVILVIGVNGVGKTTTIGKITAKLKAQGKSVILVAADTFRAAAIEQLEVWANRNGVPIIKHQEGADPGAVVYDAVFAAKSKDADVLIIDTAGRLHNKKNLMEELKKIFRIIDRELPEASKEVLLVLDATTGQNAVNQAEVFNEAAPLTGIVLTKLDGTAKGGIIISIKSKLAIPVKFVGVGEGIDDLQEFDPESFAKALFDNTIEEADDQQVEEVKEEIKEKIKDEPKDEPVYETVKEIGKVEEKIENLEEEVKETEEEIEEIKEEIKAVEKEISQIQLEMNKTIQDMEEIQSELDEIQDEIDGVYEKPDGKLEEAKETQEEPKEEEEPQDKDEDKGKFKKFLDKFKFFR